MLDLASIIHLKSLKIEVYGLVQGVGFRPFIYNLAKKFKLNGEVFNDEEGVKIEIYGKEIDCDKFIQSIKKESPPLARIDDLKILTSKSKFDDFKIIASKQASKIAPILPDFAICDECKNEFFDITNRRYQHLFINCTNCGPRFSIIKSLPYDRKNTTMSKFKMCDKCKKEYEDPFDRRYHAQPIACKDCGPNVFLKDLNSNILARDIDAVLKIANALKNGKIVAIKGIGGFHLVCDATNSNTINTLRIRKNRPDKPFAIMCKNSKMASEFAKFSIEELEILNSNLKPIVLVQSLKNLPQNLALKLDKIGIFLPPTALHLSLFEYINFPIVATSANLSAEPIITSFEDIKSKLSQVVDLVLDNDRMIANPSDDSVVFALSKKIQWIRTSRGIKPRILRSKFAKKGCFLAIGAELKNQFAIYKDGIIFSSPYIGDLKNVATFDRFINLINMFIRIYDFKFDFVVADLHPHFLHTKYFEKLGLKIYKLSHHYAHILSVMFENNIKDFVLGISFDGTGYGTDNSIWGGEVFICNENECKRVAHFDNFYLIGGQKAIKNIYYLTYAIIKKYNINAKSFIEKIPKNTIKNLDKILENKTNLVKTSSLGRIFDAFACLVLGLDIISYDAQAAMELEALYDENLDITYEFKIDNGIINFSNPFKMALNDDKIVAATGFINGVAKLILDLAKQYKIPVVLGGGVFQNRALLNKIMLNFSSKNIISYLPKYEPANDGGIAMGQIYYGLNFLGYNIK